MKNLVDSSGWLEYFSDTNNAKNFADAIEDYKNLIVPTICLFEIARKYLKIGTEDNAMEAIAHMCLGQVVDINKDISTMAAKLSINHNLAMADSLLLATAKYYEATLWTQDIDFKGIKGVKYFVKK